MERTFIIIKPDGIQRGLIGEILGRYERKGLRIAGMKFIHASRATAEEHYSVHKGKPFYDGLVSYITSAPILVAVLEGTRAVEQVRAINGATRPHESVPGSIRGDLALEVGRNLVHGSDSVDNAATEIGLWFNPEELIDWSRSVDAWVFEK